MARTTAVGSGRTGWISRVTRLIKPARPLPAVAVLGICLTAALLVAAPITLLIV